MARRRKRNSQNNGKASTQKTVLSAAQPVQPAVEAKSSKDVADSPPEPGASTSTSASIESNGGHNDGTETLDTVNASNSNGHTASEIDEHVASSEASGSGTPAAGQAANLGDNDLKDEDEDEDDEDEEPTLRYNRIQSQAVNELFQKDTCSCLTVSERYLVLGSHNGLVTIFSRPGFPRTTAASNASPSKGKGRSIEDKPSIVEAEGEHVIKKYRAHSAGIMDIVIDEESQFIGTASMDGGFR